MLRGLDIVCISSIDWDFIWQGHQQIMSALAAQGNRVLFIENTGVRSPRIQDLPRLRQRLVRWWRSTKGFCKEQENLTVFSPLIIPLPYSRLARRVNRALLMRAIRRWMRAARFGRPIVWTFLPTPLAHDLLSALEPELTVYYCIDDLASSSSQARKIELYEQQLLRMVDLVFVTSEKLRQRAARFAERVHLFPFAVDFGKFEAARTGGTPLPADLKDLSRPIVGYVGGVHQWVDQPLLAEVARRMPDAHFALVGPIQTDVSELEACRNMHLLGGHPHDEIPYYIKGFDVAIVPYRLAEYTAHVYPTKLNEYLAMGVPVVATDLPEVRRFNAEHGDVVHVATGPDQFVEATRAALKKPSPAEVARWIEVAKQNSWDARITRMSELVEERLAIRRAAGERWEESLRRLYRTARRKIARIAVGAVVAYLLFFYSPFVWFLAEPLRMAEPARSADAIVVFAGGVGESGKAGGGYQERVKQAVDLYKAGYATRIIFSSGYVFAFKEAEVMRTLADSLGVPEEAIITENQAGSTYENVAFVKEILGREGWKRVLLVSSPYHMRRAVWTWRKVAPEVEAIPAPVPHSQFYSPQGWGASLEQIRGILWEYLAIFAYWWKGWI